jgi:ABC-type multidrug transport system ATPase subunit
VQSRPPFTRLEVRSLSKRYGRLSALDGVRFDIRAREVLGLIGPNGAGKTTVFECLSGLRPADTMALGIDGRAVAPAVWRRQVFFLPDGIAPWPSETLDWMARFAVGFFAADRVAVETAIDRLGLQQLRHRRMQTYSKGQRKRALLALGLAAPQPVLMCDEPFDGLDLRQTREVAAVLREQTRAGRTLVLSIHQIADAARVCDRHVLLSAGRVVGEGTTAELAAAAGHAAADPADLEEVFLALT